MNATIKHAKVWNNAWNLGDGLWWRDQEGIHGAVLTREPSYGPRGGPKQPGLLTDICAPDMDTLNATLGELGFDPLMLSESDIAWHGKRHPRSKV